MTEISELQWVVWHNHFDYAANLCFKHNLAWTKHWASLCPWAFSLFTCTGHLWCCASMTATFLMYTVAVGGSWFVGRWRCPHFFSHCLIVQQLWHGRALVHDSWVLRCTYYQHQNTYCKTCNMPYAHLLILPLTSPWTGGLLSTMLKLHCLPDILSLTPVIRGQHTFETVHTVYCSYCKLLFIP